MKAPVLSQPRAARFNGFILLELLVVIAILGILAALLLPALRGVKQQARASTAWATSNSSTSPGTSTPTITL